MKAFGNDREAVSNSTVNVARGIVPVALPTHHYRLLPTSNVFWHAGQVSPKSRQEYFGHRPATIWLTGLSGAGKSTLAYELEKKLLSEGHPCFVLDGDNMRHRLNSDLAFSADDRRENIRRTAEVARLMNEAGLIVITALISPYRDNRAMASAIIGEQRFVEVYVSTTMDVCESRDPKGLYAKARAGKIADFTGVSSLYEPPEKPALEVNTAVLSLEASTQILFNHIAQGFFGDA